VKNNDDHLMRCFAAVFARATQEEIRTLTFSSLPGWDSLRAATLSVVLAEAFGAQITLPLLLELDTFASVKQYLVQCGVMSGRTA